MSPVLTSRLRFPVKRASVNRICSDLQLLLEFAVETSQHGVGFLVFSDGHLDFPPLPGLQPGRVFLESDFCICKEPKYRTVPVFGAALEGAHIDPTRKSLSRAVRFI